MVVKLHTKFCASLFVAFQFATNLQAGIFWGHPYQDRYFNYNSTPRYGSSGYSGAQNGPAHGYSSNMEMNAPSETMHSGLSSGAMVGSHRPSMNAILRVWVPDGLTVEVNGYPTRPQSLAGIHGNSRVFSLEGLDMDRVSPCDIVVKCFDQLGNTLQYRRALSVSGGGNYEVRFPRDFEPMVEHSSEFETVHPMMETTILESATVVSPDTSSSEVYSGPTPTNGGAIAPPKTTSKKYEVIVEKPPLVDKSPIAEDPVLPLPAGK